MEGDGWDATDIRQIDLDDYLSRFEIKKRGDYKAESLAAYRTRFTSERPDWREPPVHCPRFLSVSAD